MPDIRASLEAAVAKHRGGDLDGAAGLYRHVLALSPKNGDALHLLGLVQHQRGDHVGALALVEQARLERPHNAEIVYNLGRICLALQDWPMAAEANQAALKLAPDMRAAWCNLGVALVHLGRAVEGEEAIRTSLGDDAASWSALGLALHHQNKEREAEAAWEKSLTFNTDFAEARFNLACAQLRRKDFARGWSSFTARAQADPASFATGGAMPADIPRWRGESLADKTVLVWGEQGLGDQILFAQLLPALGARAVIFACAPRLAPLFRRAFPAVTVLAQDDGLQERLAAIGRIDMQLALGDLGGLACSATVPLPSPFLRPDSQRVAALRERYRWWSGGKPLVGVSWHSRRATAGALKSLPLAAWSPLLATPNACFLSIQYGESEPDLAAAGLAGHAVHRDPEVDATHDLDALAAQIAALDLVISVSNTTVHIAGGLGVPVWTLAPVGGGSLWYWFEPQPSWQPSPWYSAMRVYHQDAPGDWNSMLQRIKVDLEHFCAGVPAL